ncbi:hypothetical protein IGI04_025676 [Brassica rapa subsp. trilocularis]|uniref:Uncharacterized protein n=1 Tax=Brassica rapa subsp. trilocularis TaxID=1813537 RepID=A0ABQ7KWY1_BRACM|nr:hypothetical protein IGI04_025676 [Brassica rapa subsp. trilocularis]
MAWPNEGVSLKEKSKTDDRDMYKAVDGIYMLPKLRNRGCIKAETQSFPRRYGISPVLRCSSLPEKWSWKSFRRNTVDPSSTAVDLSSTAGVYASCLRERLLSLAASAAKIRRRMRRRSKPPVHHHSSGGYRILMQGLRIPLNREAVKLRESPVCSELDLTILIPIPSLEFPARPHLRRG